MWKGGRIFKPQTLLSFPGFPNEGVWLACQCFHRIWILPAGSFLCIWCTSDVRGSALLSNSQWAHLYQNGIQDNIEFKNSFLQKDESKFPQDRVWDCDLRLISFQHNWDRNTRGFFSATRLSSCLKSFRKIKKKKTNFFYSQSKVRSKQMQSFEKRNNCI